MTCIGRHVASCLATITNGVLISPPPSRTMTLTSESNQWYKQETPLDPTTLALPLQSSYSHVHGRLKTSKIAGGVMAHGGRPDAMGVGNESGNFWTEYGSEFLWLDVVL